MMIEMYEKSKKVFLSMAFYETCMQIQMCSTMKIIPSIASLEAWARVQGQQWLHSNVWLKAVISIDFTVFSVHPGTRIPWTRTRLRI